MIEENGNNGWFFAGVSTVVATLASCVAFLFRLLESKNSAAIAVLQKQVIDLDQEVQQSNVKHDKCEEDRVRLSVDLATVKSQLSRYIKAHD